MKAYRFDASKKLEGAYGAQIGLTLRAEVAPTPGPGQVLVRLKANALNFVDLVCLMGAFPVDGRVPLMDGAGIVEAIGPGVARWKIASTIPAPIRI